MSHIEQDLYTDAPVWKAVRKLALPSIFVQVVLVIYNMADTFYIGMMQDNVMTTAVTICTPAFMFLSAFANLFGIGASGVMSRALGRSNPRRAKNVTRCAFYGCLFVSVLYSLFSYLFLDTFANLLGGSNPEVHVLAREYLMITVVLGGIPTVLNNFIAHLVRSEGKSTIASVGLIAGGVLNIGLDPLFMFVLLPQQNGVIGAAVATAVSNFIALLYYIAVVIYLRLKNQTVISFHFRKEMFENHVLREILRTGFPACVMTFCENISYAFLENIIGTMGVAAQAGLGVAKKINMLAHSMVRGLSQGVLSLIGYTYGAKNYERMKSVIRTTIGFSLLLSTLCLVGCFCFGKYLSLIFLPVAGEAMEYSILFLNILCLGAPFSAVAYTIISFFQATKQIGKSTLLALLRKGILDIPLMYLFTVFLSYGSVWATPVADVVCSIVAVILLYTWNQKHLKNDCVVSPPHNR